MDRATLHNIFSETYNHENWLKILQTTFGAKQLYTQPKPILLPSNERAIGAYELGSFTTSDDRIIGLYRVDVKPDVWLERNKVSLRALLRNVYKYDVDGAIVVFVQKEKWRLSFVSEIKILDNDGNVSQQSTEPKRYTYLLGENEKVRTPSDRLSKLSDKTLSLQDILNAFSVEALNEEFFKEYQKQYEKFVLFLTGEIWKKNQNKYTLTKIKEPSPLLQMAFYSNKKNARDFCKKLLGRIVFLHFLQKKGWLGNPLEDLGWKNGDSKFMLNLFEGFEIKEHFHSACLTELFFNTLNKPRENDVFDIKGLNSSLNKSKIPYLNGGLFEMDSNLDPFKVDFPTSYFFDLLNFFAQYNFTIDENSPIDFEIGIDPEMLGHIFENLLEENKEKGVFYTPKEIVKYMTQESLIQYLQTYLGEHDEIGKFIQYNDIGDRKLKHNFIRDNAARIEELLDNVKICDPAIGSGAFPMGILNEIFEAKMALDMTLDRAEVKRNIIQNSIYGVDLESGAVDIARLRFWLALVVDEDEPQPLPNLEYKILQGNSLLESFEDIDLSKIYKSRAIKIDDTKVEDNLFSKGLDVVEIENSEILEDLIKTYFDLDNSQEKKVQHDKIDKQILGRIYKGLHDKYKALEKDYKTLNNNIKNKSTFLKTADQKIKYETTSKDAKEIKKVSSQLDSIAGKQLKLKSLFDSNDRPFFLWHLMFKEIIVDKGGFDIIIGNPPYGVSIQGEYRTNLMRELGKVPDFEIYYYFVELAYKLSKQNTILSYIIPNTYLFNTFAESYRNEIIDKWNIIEILDCTKFDIFKNATVRNTINTWKKGEGNFVGYRKTKNIDTFLELVKEERIYMPKEELKTMNQNWGLAFFLDSDTVSIVNKIKSNKNRLDAFFKVSQGYIPYRRSDLVKDYGIEKGNAIIDNREWHSDISISDEYLPEIFGRDLNKYGRKNFSRLSYIKYGKHLAGYVDLEYFNRKRLLVREITNPLIIATIIEEVYVNDPQLISIIPDSEIVSLEFLWCILNSKLASFYHFNYSPKATKGAFPKILVKDIREFPIVIPENSQPFEILVNYLAFLNDPTQPAINKYADNASISLIFEDVINLMVYELYFTEHLKELGLDVLKYIETEQYFKLIDTSDSADREANAKIIGDCYNWLQKQENPIRNRILLSNIKSPEIIKRINASTH